MTVGEVLNIIEEESNANIWYGDGIKGQAGDLLMAINESLLNAAVDCIEHTAHAIEIHLKGG